MGNARLGGRKVLLVEDEPLIALDLRDALSGAGATVVSASDAPEAARLVGSPALAAAIVDVNLGALDCWIVCRLLARRGVPFMFYTGYTKANVLQEWPDAPVLAKPASAEQIVAAVGSLLEARLDEHPA